MKSYYRVMLGKQSMYADECLLQGFIGTDFGITADLTGRLPENWKDFNKEFIPIYLEANPEKSRVAAGLACGMVWTVSRGILEGDIVLCPDGGGNYLVGEVYGNYGFAKQGVLPHRRSVRWLENRIARKDMSEALQRSAGSVGTAINITKYAQEIEQLVKGFTPAGIDESIEDPAAFALEKHLEDFLIRNWNATSLGKDYLVYEIDGECVGQQFPTDTGPIDILAISKDGQTLLVVELKKGRASDAVVGQVLRYMGYVQDDLAEPGQTVRGLIIALEDDQRLRRALAMVPAVEFSRYEIRFTLKTV